jgi:BirA family biotin operon repressor/biotin-[acetyl-CoA-carboxylase] ligase
MTDAAPASAADAPLDAWPARLAAALASCRHIRRAIVLATTDSTQDAARRLQAAPGDVIVAARQTAGRGRLGRPWSDTADRGIAVTIVLHQAPVEPPALAVAVAVGVARAAEQLLHAPVGIKWPNDIVVARRKLAGILIEHADGLAHIGIGLNVAQLDWPLELAERAVSLAQLGTTVDRLEVLAHLLPAVDGAIDLDADALRREWARRDALRGAAATIRHNGRLVRGTVVEIDPLRWLKLRTGHGDITLPAATTTAEEYAFP